MRRIWLSAWLLTPVAILGLHYGPGQAHLARDRADDFRRAAEAAAAGEKWPEALAMYQQALALLPEDDGGRRDRLELAHARTRIYAGQMIEGQEQLEKLLARLEQAPQRDTELMTSVAHELASASYYTAWVMRLEGATAEEWKPEAERARQQFRLLAERAAEATPADAEVFQKNLEATIRLEQMDLTMLQAKPLPKKCCNCKNLSQRKRKQCQSRCKGPGSGDARQQIQQSRGAGLNEREGTGS